MHPHHTQSIHNVAEYFQRDPGVLALLLGGSIAHGFESPTSDVDIMIFVSDENYQQRFQKGEIHFYNKELCTYEGGYVDGKYLSLEFVKQFAAGGSEPARFAFAGSNELLYPYHKWFLKVLEGAKDKPDDMLPCIYLLNESPIDEKIEVFYEKIRTFQPWTDTPFSWPAQFMLDSELNWMDGRTSVDDL